MWCKPNANSQQRKTVLCDRCVQRQVLNRTRQNQTAMGHEVYVTYINHLSHSGISFWNKADEIWIKERKPVSWALKCYALWVVGTIYSQLSSIITKWSLSALGLTEILTVFDEKIRMAGYPLGVLISSLKEKNLISPWPDPWALQTSHSQDPALPEMTGSCQTFFLGKSWDTRKRPSPCPTPVSLSTCQDPAYPSTILNKK